VEYARVVGARVEVVTGYVIPITIFLTPSFTDADYHREAQAQLDATLQGALDAASDTEVDVHSHVVPVRPGLALHNAAQDAHMVIWVRTASWLGKPPRRQFLLAGQGDPWASLQAASAQSVCREPDHILVHKHRVCAHLPQ